MNEDHPTLPHSTYASSKLAGDRAIATMQKENDLPAVVIRPFNCYGPRFTQPYIIPEIMTSLLASDSVTLGNVEASRDFTFVSDTANGIILAGASESAIGETINLGSNMSITIRELVDKIAEVMGRSSVRITLDSTRVRPWDVDKLICDYSKAEEKLGWKPRTSLKDGLARTVEWLKRNPVKLREPFRGWTKTYKSNASQP
jgi:dTDP-glucose 4,6-dehydratase